MTRAYERHKVYKADKPCASGHPPIRYITGGKCVECTRIFNKKISGSRSPSENAEIMARWRRKNPIAALIINARARAKKLGIPFSLKEEDLHIPQDCPCCGRRMEFVSGDKNNTPSIDRLDTDGPYSKGNINIICYRCNCIKWDVKTPEELENVARWFRSKLEVVSQTLLRALDLVGDRYGDDQNRQAQQAPEIVHLRASPRYAAGAEETFSNGR